MVEFILIIMSSAALLGYCMLAFHLTGGLAKAGRQFYNRKKNGNPGKISVITALRNEEKNVEELIDAIAKQDYPDYEAIIVDDDSDDRTKSLAEQSCAGKDNFKVISAGENKFGWGPKKNAIHHGIENCFGEIIVTTDADCRPGPEWLSGIAECFDHDTGAVAGFSPLIFDTGFRGRLKSLEAFATAIISAAFIGVGRPFMAVGRNFAYSKKTYYEIGGFGEAGGISPAGDDDLLIQAIGNKTKVIFTFDKGAIVPSFPESGGYIGRKRRHFNSAKHYSPEFILIGTLVYVVITCILVLITAGIIIGSLLMIISGLIALQVKILMDLSLLELGSRMLGEKYSVFDVLITEFLQIPYTLLLQPASMIGRINWKGRKL